MRLSYTTFLARDVDLLATFYIDGLGLEEVASSRDHRYREVRAGGAMIGFAFQGARAMLNAGEEAPVGTRSLLTFDVGAIDAIGPAVARAEHHGARVLRGEMDTFFGQRQVVLADPEGNLFRLSAAIGA